MRPPTDAEIQAMELGDETVIWQTKWTRRITAVCIPVYLMLFFLVRDDTTGVWIVVFFAFLAVSNLTVIMVNWPTLPSLRASRNARDTWLIRRMEARNE